MISGVKLALLKRAGSAALKAYRQDRSNRYQLREAWVIPPPDDDTEIPDYEGLFIQIADRQITFLPDGGAANIDGASMAPDKIGSKNSFIEAAIAHDLLYNELEAIAAAWGWKRRKVRALADRIFYSIALQFCGDKLWPLVYYFAVRPFGGIFHALARLVLLLVLAAYVAGCRAPKPLWADTPIPPPVYEKTN